MSTVLNPSPNFLPVFGNTTFMGGIDFMAGGTLGTVLLRNVVDLVAQGLALFGELARWIEEPLCPCWQAPENQTGYPATLRYGN